LLGKHSLNKPERTKCNYFKQKLKEIEELYYIYDAEGEKLFGVWV